MRTAARRRIPTARTGKVGHRHQLDDRDSWRREISGSTLRRIEITFGRAGANVQLIDDGLFPRSPVPVEKLPVAGKVDKHARLVNVLRVRARCWIGHLDATGQLQALAVYGVRARDLGAMPTLRILLHGMTDLRIARSEQQPHLRNTWRPQREMRDLLDKLSAEAPDGVPGGKEMRQLSFGGGSSKK